MELENILRTAFPSLSEQSLAMIAKQCRLVKHPKNGILFLEGDTGTGFYALSSGTVKIYKTSPAGQETVLRLQGPGSIFAEVILFESGVYPVSAAAMTPVSAVLIPREHFLGLLDEPRFRNEFIATLMHKQRYLTDRILYLTSLDVEERFFRFLVEHYGVQEEYSLELSKKDIASAIGTIPETLSRLFERLRGRGIISWKGPVLAVDRDYLEQFARESLPGGFDD